MQIKDLNNVPINESASQNPQDERKENYIFWTKSNQPVTDEYPNGKWIWIVGPNYEKKSDKPPDLRNLGKGLEMSDINLRLFAVTYSISLILPCRFRKAGRVWCGGARET